MKRIEISHSHAGFAESRTGKHWVQYDENTTDDARLWR
ncbi:predicted protein [Sclerotinia sclerotiorum 1980 UF-70]|uniref:Uncharacterized protein n=1 Tax=Sclerotinia sclerotiorum (strain ATCC 18683 / 1980 / Ss-1) TaxID=665079 RepID=A7F330_SCLS1|nr:predicted protein [Sclerotinia sclerotiorum 1980 UF-70]EDN96122.1 predicted protein [Sclerotinia sclerotiorum 1980 UF-70]